MEITDEMKRNINKHIEKIYQEEIKKILTNYLYDIGEKEIDIEPWCPEKGDYYFIDSTSEILPDIYTGSDRDIKRVNNYNAFGSHKQAEQTAKREYAHRKLRRIADVLNGEWLPDWSDNQYKFYIYRKLKNEWSIDSIITSYQPGQVYFQSKQKAQKFIELMGPDIKYL
jgi:hypothetical protein